MIRSLTASAGSRLMQRMPRFGDLDLPERTIDDLRPVPVLRLATLELFDPWERRGRSGEPTLDIAALTFDYGGTSADRDAPGTLTTVRHGVRLRIRRDHDAEKHAHDRLRATGFVVIRDTGRAVPQVHQHDYTLPHDQDWLDFMADALSALQADGWQVVIDEGFRYRLARVDGWRAAVRDVDADSFALDLTVDVDGRPMDLLPVLITAVRERPDLLHRDTIASARPWFVRLDDGRHVAVPLAAIRPVLAVLHEVAAARPGERLRLGRLDAARLAQLERETGFAVDGDAALLDFGRRLAGFDGVAPVPTPAALAATLRPYQCEGLAWLQFLREYRLGGILADDMGLGKTLQTLAFVLVEKAAGRLDRPVLIVAPTSVLPNWRAEAARFAPTLRVHVSHGLKRRADFGHLRDFDIVLTAYALLARDEATLAAEAFHAVILDEAQLIKNARTKAARVAARLDTRHRFCLTGTPVENHLGELWSLFDFCLPGFLGDAERFKRQWRVPIEKQGDEDRRDQLARRVRPFILRRTKEQVASDLPAKSEIVRAVELGPAQRAFYESVRVALYDRVRDEIAHRGIAGSQIVVLEALLKLRQICCDPRLVKLDGTEPPHESAKLDVLRDMLGELVAQGRRVLVFSQFTSMLDLIEPELDALGLRWLVLTGATRDREKPVKAFQAGEAPVFLVSLKAGGVGLNLTAADTVVHFDPWWNPAVENQATDRAHRIGQDKPVFVFKLVATGTVEERILALQASKAALAAGILDAGALGTAPLTADDVAALFEPLHPAGA
ncbi:MAG: DEAD/DEAH box helicase [Burkholderiales bacterium]|nr:DEAD/DEAH box helicase [Burkholderiales bacterium]